ncbi:hypothetical protein [Microbispora sp. NPDC049633]|uniref:hypothetical protein n=1 Tax=Microbispora sp. NPDC049633 TaxID=3154355 RepID=UPI0034367E8D
MIHPTQAAKIEYFKLLCAALESARIEFQAYGTNYNDPSVTIPLKGSDLLEVVAMAGDAVRLYATTVEGVQPPRLLGTLTDLGDVLVLVKARIDRSFA